MAFVRKGRRGRKGLIGAGFVGRRHLEIIVKQVRDQIQWKEFSLPRAIPPA
jgi:hypothetical protein